MDRPRTDALPSPARASDHGPGTGSGPAVGELCDRYARVSTAAVNDVLRARGLTCQVLPHAIAPVRDDMRLAGVAFTIRGARSARLEDEMEERAAMLEQIPEHSICVWDTSGDEESAQWGEVMTMAAQRRGCRGAVVDGGVRDTEKVLGLGFPVFARYRTSNGMLGRFRMTGWQVGITLGGVAVAPGDLLVGDLDGVIVVPRALAEETLVAAEGVERAEVGIKQMVASGLDPREVVRRGGYF
ncbi:RraA family protein [Streptomyces sp. NPDC060194]|uniref:RraA family protein n=1 Tax=Streptomyces sp. NPDC060194 TaxID=3347069 RepID=UPI003662B3A2